MGCYPPLVKFVSKALRKCNGAGRERWRKERLDYAMAYPPGPPMETHFMRPVARTVTFASNNNVYVIIPPKQPPPKEQPPPQQQEQSTAEPQQPQTAPPPQPEPDHHDNPPEQPQPEQPAAPAQEKKAEDAPPAAEPNPKPPKAPKRGKNKKSGRVRFGPDPPPLQEEQQQQQDEHAADTGNGGGDAPPAHQGQHGDGRRGGPAPAQMPAYLFRYTPSPLPRWEATPRRHEYFSGEYRSYYPTPVREGIYRIATDANRLTTIFSEENPNACAIL